MKKLIFITGAAVAFMSCNGNKTGKDNPAEMQVSVSIRDSAHRMNIPPVVITDTTPNDTDDPAIWINRKDPAASLIVGTDKEEKNGGLYLYNLEGKIVNKIHPLDRPNNVDVIYDVIIGKDTIDVAVATERKTSKVRVVSLPEFKLIDNGGLEVFKGEELKDPMGIATYKNPADNKNYVIVGRKDGKNGTYLHQYELVDNHGRIGMKFVRAFGNYSGKKEIEAIMVDAESGYIYYSDETAGIRKYHADPSKGNDELAFFGQDDFARDMEGIALYKTSRTDGYILISNQQDNTFNVYKRQGEPGAPHQHTLIVKIPMSTNECDGADATNVSLGDKFPKGLFVAMSDEKVFHIYNWIDIEKRIVEGK